MRTRKGVIDLQTLANIGELLGGIGVIGSILFLAFETRRNSRIQLRANHREVTRYLDDTIVAAVGKSEFSKAYLKGFEDLSSVEPHERFQIDVYMLSWLRASEHSLLDYSLGFLSEDAILPIRHAIYDHLSTPGGRQWWAERRNWFTAEGQSQFDTILDSEAWGGKRAGASPAQAQRR